MSDGPNRRTEHGTERIDWSVYPSTVTRAAEKWEAEHPETVVYVVVRRWPDASKPNQRVNLLGAFTTVALAKERVTRNADRWEWDLEWMGTTKLGTVRATVSDRIWYYISPVTVDQMED